MFVVWRKFWVYEKKIEYEIFCEWGGGGLFGLNFDMGEWVIVWKKLVCNLF